MEKNAPVLTKSGQALAPGKSEGSASAHQCQFDKGLDLFSGIRTSAHLTEYTEL